MEKLVYELLKKIGEDPDRKGLKYTPERVAKAYKYFMRGYRQNLKDILNGALFEEKYDEMVIVKNIDYYSMCEHHLLPFFGKAHVAYIPNGKIIGISKIPRIVDMYARRLQVQERMTTQIADALQGLLNPLGVAVVVEGQHLCMMMRGVEKQNSVMITSAMYGAFRNRTSTREEFLRLIKS
ncbi:GTP cyclohydrolase 1 [bacterium BMS3Abin05]|nr:GTP cyclohydrolase 1 [bacterium BMS3Abin05]GBE28227.1 GTP cyclohydrolase 1 [bacterium BMS3Bbin03]